MTFRYGEWVSERKALSSERMSGLELICNVGFEMKKKAQLEFTFAKN